MNMIKHRPVHAIENQRAPGESFHCSFSIIFSYSFPHHATTVQIFVHYWLSIHLPFPFLVDCASAHAGIPHHL